MVGSRLTPCPFCSLVQMLHAASGTVLKPTGISGCLLPQLFNGSYHLTEYSWTLWPLLTLPPALCSSQHLTLCSSNTELFKLSCSLCLNRPSHSLLGKSPTHPSKLSSLRPFRSASQGPLSATVLETPRVGVWGRCKGRGPSGGTLNAAPSRPQLWPRGVNQWVNRTARGRGHRLHSRDSDVRLPRTVRYVVPCTRAPGQGRE